MQESQFRDPLATEKVWVTPAMKKIIRRIENTDTGGECYESLFFLLQMTCRHYDLIREIAEKGGEHFYVAFELIEVFDLLRAENRRRYEQT